MGMGLHTTCLFLLLLNILASESLEKLSTPTNLRIESYNLKQKLTWDPVLRVDDATVTYIVQYKIKSGQNWYEVVPCANITKSECDFTDAVNLFWRVKLRVQARLEPLESDWAETTEYFDATRDTVIGPVTSLKVTPESGSLLIRFSAPFENVPDGWNMEYNICHWEKRTATKDEVCAKTKKTIYTLPNVKHWTEYCIEVKPLYQPVLVQMKGNSGGVICEETQTTDTAGVGKIALILFLSTVALFVVGLGCFFCLHRFHKDIKHWLSPSFRMPYHIEQYFHDNCQNEFVQKLESESSEEDHYDKLSFVSNEELI